MVSILVCQCLHVATMMWSGEPLWKFLKTSSINIKLLWNEFHSAKCNSGLRCGDQSQMWCHGLVSITSFWLCEHNNSDFVWTILERYCIKKNWIWKGKSPCMSSRGVCLWQEGWPDVESSVPPPPIHTHFQLSKGDGRLALGLEAPLTNLASRCPSNSHSQSCTALC